ncbi:MAG: CRTAC1 family protein [Acidobacteria bacterium]|nr:CRTAC1 family protein [Acidobacteriota bacterium]
MTANKRFSSSQSRESAQAHGLGSLLLKVGGFLAGVALLAIPLITASFSLDKTTSPFINGAGAAGIEFEHQRGASDRKHLVETMGSGCAFLDYDSDGWLDLLLINGGTTPDSPPSGPVRHALYRNLSNGKFKDVTIQSGLTGKGSYGMGVAVGDYDNDGYPDIYITNFGPNVLYHNNRDGSFSDVTEKAGVGCPEWSSSAAFFDYDNDGYLDLYVTNYVDSTYEKNPVCTVKNIRAYCHPKYFLGVADKLYRNFGNGRFEDVSKKSGIANPDGKGLGVVAADFDGDGWMDLYVANDSVRNCLFKNNRNGTFTDETFSSGTGYNGEAKAEASMGVDAGDYDGDGLMDIMVTNYDLETNALYRNEGGWIFGDERWPSGLARTDRFLLGFGVGFFDFDNDGDQDLLLVNGHVIDNVEVVQPDFRHAQPMQLLENQRGKYSENLEFFQFASTIPRVGRGACFGDIDNDGDIDVLINNSEQEPTLLINQVGNRRGWILLKLIGTKSNRDAVGAKITVTTENGSQTDQITGGASYLSASDLRVHFGLASARVIKLMKIKWPSGSEQVLQNIRSNQVLTIKEEEPK